MSDVTNLILTFSISEDEISKVQEINCFWNNGRGFNLISADFERGQTLFGKENEKRWYGGDKKLETPLFIGAYNHLDLDGLIEFLKGLEWNRPENVQLIVKEEGSEKFRLIELL